MKKYRPDFLVRLTNGTTLVLEVKGQKGEQARVKREALKRWVNAVNEHGAFGHWAEDMSERPKEIVDILKRHVSESTKTGLKSIRQHPSSP